MKQSLHDDHQRYLRRVLISGLLCAFFAVDVVTPSVIFSDTWLLSGLLAGICIGEVNLIAAWAALAPGNLLFRLPWSMLLGVLMWCGLVLGHRIQPALDDPIGILAPHSALDSAAPCWIASRYVSFPDSPKRWYFDIIDEPVVLGYAYNPTLTDGRSRTFHADWFVMIRVAV